MRKALRHLDVEVLEGRDGITRMVQDPATDRVLNAIVGAAGLDGTLAALEAGKTVALANKETLVVAGPLVMDLARSARGTSAPRRQRAFGDLPVASGRQAQGRQAGHPHLFRWALSRQIEARAARRHARRGTQASHLADGPQDHDRLGHADEQGARGDRGALAVRTRARSDRGRDSSRERGSLHGRVCRWQRGRPAFAAGHAAADSVCAHLS